MSLLLEIVLLCCLIAAFFLRTPQVSGPSMEPHIESGEYVLINTLAYHFGEPARGDIVAFRHGDDPPTVFIKRVIGLPGDRVKIQHGTVYVNGARLAEPYVRFHDTNSFAQTVVPAKSLYVLGDNRANSEDSRVFGSVPEQSLIGKAVAGIWPSAGAL